MGVEPIPQELKDAIQLFVQNVSKSFIVEWYKILSQTNEEFVIRLEALLEEILLKLAQACIDRLDKYRTGQIVTTLIHEHVLSHNIEETIKSIEDQINNYEYDICQDFVVRLYGLLCNETFKRIILTETLASDFQDAEQEFQDLAQQSLGQDRFSPIPRSGTNETSALYTLVIAMLTKSVFMPIVDIISTPKWLYALIIWFCDREISSLEAPLNKKDEKNNASKDKDTNPDLSNGKVDIGIDAKKDAADRPVFNSTKPGASVRNFSTYRSLDLEEGVDIVTTNINFENPICDSLKRPLDNIEIYSTEEVQTNNTCFVLYCIRYDGLCHRHPSAGANVIIDSSKPLIDKRGTISTTDSTRENKHSMVGVGTSRKSFRRPMTIKRRFREFVILQLRLEENPKIRPYMKNIPKPTKLKAATQNIFSLPGITNIKLDQSTIRLRQKFLERFLIALNNSPFIANSYEFREFFNYNINSSVNNISKSKSLILQVNLNKVLVESVRSAFSIIKATLPGKSVKTKLELC